MVTDISLAQRLFGGLRRDIGGLWGALTPAAPPEPGLYTYRIELPGGRRRIHLRIEGDGAGVLFVDVTDAIHLNPTAAEMAKMALEDVPIEQARGRLLGRYRGAPGARVDEELAAIYAMVDGFRRPESGCPTCAVSFLQRAPLFSTRARAPYKVDLALTYGCNNECPHCYNEPGRLGMASLSKTDWLRVLDRLAEIGVPHIIFTGGEATLHPDLPDLIRYADGLGQVTGLNTNGRRLAHRPYMRTLAEVGLDHVQITLGSSYPEVHDAMMGAASFHQTVRGIHSALDSGVHAITNTTLMRCNMDHVEHIVDFLFALGIRTFAMNGMIYSGGGFADPNAIPEHELAPLLVRVRDHAAALDMRFLWYTPTEYCRMSPVELEIGAKRCNAGEYSMCVEPNGDVLPCQSYYVSAGNILRDAWEKIWQGDLFRSFREREEDPRWAGLPEKCWECPDLPLCGGGCRIEREAREGRRVAEGAGGCSGCGGGSLRRETLSATAGFIPSAGLINTAVRASGKMAVPVIGLSDIPVSVASTEYVYHQDTKTPRH